MPLFNLPSGSSGVGAYYQVSGYDTLILGETGIAHYYPGTTDTSAVTQLTDVKGSQPITLAGNCMAGHPGVVNDGSYSVHSQGLAGDKCTFPNTTFLPASKSPFSFDFWYKMINLVSPGSVQIWFTTDANNSVMVYSSSSGTYHGIYLNNGAVVPTNLAVVVGVPMHVAYTFDGTTSTLYINGISVYSAAVSPTFPGTGNGQLFAFNTNTDPCVGFLHKIAGYTAALSATQVKNHYKAGIPVS